jgi:hypothetical protein
VVVNIDGDGDGDACIDVAMAKSETVQTGERLLR